MTDGTRDPSNQPPPYEDVNLFASDPPLMEAVRANGAAADEQALVAFGRRWGSSGMLARAKTANARPPELVGDPGAERVAFDSAYHAFMTESLAAGLHATTWKPDGTRAPAPAEVERAARYYQVAQIENGHMCPVTMTRASVGGLAAEPALLELLMTRIGSRVYDPSFRPWFEKTGITIGMGMTEKQGGTDVRANSTHAEPVAGGYLITGHKWFMSAPMSDAFLVLAQAPAGLTCFFLPRFTPDSRINALHFVRLKDKLGNRSNASSEVEFAGAFALRVGEEGKGIRTILNMVQLTRLDCAISSAGLMRMAFAQALHHARHRTVFQNRLVNHPMMGSVLADIGLAVEGALALTMRLARAFDLADSDPREAARARLLTPAAKYWICKTAPGLVYEAMECLGGNGYVEDSVLPRLYREAPVNAIWEGSGNVMCLDVLRVLSRDGEAARQVVRQLARDAAGLPGVDETAAAIERIVSGNDAESHARLAIERLALLGAVAALHENGSPAAIPFARTRLAAGRGILFGATDLRAREIQTLLQRALPE